MIYIIYPRYMHFDLHWFSQCAKFITRFEAAASVVHAHLYYKFLIFAPYNYTWKNYTPSRELTSCHFVTGSPTIYKCRYTILGQRLQWSISTENLVMIAEAEWKPLIRMDRGTQFRRTAFLHCVAGDKKCSTHVLASKAGQLFIQNAVLK